MDAIVFDPVQAGSYPLRDSSNLVKNNRIHDGVEAETRKSQASFQIIKSYPRLAEHNYLKTSLRFPC